MTTWFRELHNTLVQRCSPLSVSSSQIRRNPSSCHPPHPCPHCHIGSDAGYLPAGKPASPGTTTGNANLRITNLRRKESAQLPQRLGEHRGPPCYLLPLLSLLLTVSFWCSRDNSASGSLVVMPTQGSVQLQAWYPLSWEGGCLCSLYCKASSRCLSLSIQGLGIFTPARAVSTMASARGTKSEMDQEPIACQAKQLFIPFSSHTDPQPHTWHPSSPFSTLQVLKISSTPLLFSSTLG